MSEEKKTVPHRVVMAGRVTLQGGAVGVEFYGLTSTNETIAGQTTDSRHVFAAKKGFRHLTVGGIYELQGNEDLTSVVLSAKFLGMFPDDAQVAAWKTLDRASEIERDLRKREKEGKQRPYLARMLSPLVREYRTATPLARLAIEVEVLRALRSGTF